MVLPTKSALREYNRLAVVMGGVSSKDESWEVARLTTTARLKMKNACILCKEVHDQKRKS